MEKVQFDKTKLLDYLITSLRNKNLLPKPHLGVLETKFPIDTKTKGTFTYSDKPASQNIIGYDFLVQKNGDTPSTKTIFNFFVRNGDIKSSKESNEDSFIPIQIIVDMNIKEPSCKILIKNKKTGEIYKEENLIKYKELDSKSFFKVDWEKNFIVKYKEHGKENFKEAQNNIKLTVLKNVKKESDGIYRIQLRIINENEKGEKSSLSKVGINEADFERYLKIPLGLVLDFDTKEECSQSTFYIHPNRWGIETSILRLFNLVPQKESLASIEFSEYYRGYETIPLFKAGSPKDKFILEAEKQGIKIHQDVANSYRHIDSFYKYQEEGIIKIAKEIKEKNGEINIISVRTAGGKTETFAVPLINYCYENIDKIGTKSLIFYPTKALANDQAARIFKSLYQLNKILKEKGKRRITMGIYHGDIKKSPDEERELWVPFKCPACNSQISFKIEGIRNFAFCSNCNEDLSYLILTRYEIHRDTPDIIITNQDTLHYTLMTSPENHSIFGREINYCEECGTSYLNKRVCPMCHKPLIKIEPQCSPEIIILDEIHMLGGAFGINTSMFLKRMINTIKKYTKNEIYNPTFIGATATIKHPVEFAKQLFNSNNINKIPLDEASAYIEGNAKEESVQREHLFMLPRSYDSSDTLSYGVHYLLKYFAENFEEKPTILGFCESIKDNRNLIKLTNSRKPKIEGKHFLIGGHTSQFGRDERAEMEKKFTRKEIDILYATSTLQVGVDFDEINVLLLHGVPFSFNDYLQRVGRSGRKRDAAVITTLRKWSSLDYFYLEKCKSMLSNPKNFIVDPPFNKENEVILRNHIIASFFDYLCLLSNTEKVVSIGELKEFISDGNQQNGISSGFREEFIKYCKSCFGDLIKNSSLINKTLDLLQNDFIFKNTEGVKDIHELFNAINEKHQIGQLRNADKVVEVTFQI